MKKRKFEKEKRKIQNINDDMLTAAKNLQLSVTRLIIGLGANSNATEMHGFTPLHLTAGAAQA